jgi:predicted acyl esterase
MKRMFVLSMLISFAMICACQKRDSAAEAQLAQRKAELDKREKALNEREKALSRRPVVEPEEAKAERDRRLQQLPPELQALIRDRLLLDARIAAKAGEQKTEPQNYGVVSKRHAERR